LPLAAAWLCALRGGFFLGFFALPGVFPFLPTAVVFAWFFACSALLYACVPAAVAFL